MPRFYKEVEATLDIDVQDFIDACDDDDIRELSEYIYENYPYHSTTNSKQENLLDQILYDNLLKIFKNKLIMDQSDIDTINNIASKY